MSLLRSKTECSYSIGAFATTDTGGTTDFKWKEKTPGHYVPYRKWERELHQKQERIDWNVVYAITIIITMIGTILMGGVIL